MTPAVTPRTVRGAAGMLGVPGGIALAAAVAALLTLVVQVGPLARAILAPRAESSEAFAGDDARTQRFRSAFDAHIAQIDGRSMFFAPAAPAPPAREPAPRNDRPERAPTRYDGPAIIAMINGSVWFADGRRLTVGAEPDASLGVLAQDGPWSARVVWKGVEFDVPLFERTTDRFLDAPAQAEPVEQVPGALEGEPANVIGPDDEVETGDADEATQEEDPA